jgi:hypothetical protein
VQPFLASDDALTEVIEWFEQQFGMVPELTCTPAWYRGTSITTSPATAGITSSPRDERRTA